MRKTSALLILLFLVMNISACSSIHSQYTLGNVEKVGEEFPRESKIISQVVNNCGIGGSVLTYTPSYSTLLSNSIEWQFNGQTGVGLSLPEGLNLNLVGGLNIADSIGQGVQYGNAWQLTAKENEAVRYTIELTENWQNAIVYVFDDSGNKLNQVNITYRASFTTEVKSKDLLNCDEVLQTNQPTLNLTAQPTEQTPQSGQSDSCWQTVWKFDPASDIDISSMVRPPMSAYYQYGIAQTISHDGVASFRVETNHQVADLLADSNAFSWVINSQGIPVENAKYRIIAWMKTENSTQSHISIVAQDSSHKDIYVSDSNQMAKAPIYPQDGSYDWTQVISQEFNPLIWSQNASFIEIGINGGPSNNGLESITWFDDVELQVCK